VDVNAYCLQSPLQLYWYIDVMTHLVWHKNKILRSVTSTFENKTQGKRMKPINKIDNNQLKQISIAI
jgi:hypothetical protein